MKVQYIPQTNEPDCGVAALAMILNYYGTTMTLSRIRRLTKTSKKGTTALGIVKAAEKLNLHTEAIQGDMSLFEEKNISYPFIVHVLKDKKLLHYYVVLGREKNGDLLIADPDPSVRLRKMRLKEFQKEWTNVAIFFWPSKEYIPYKEKESVFSTFIPLLQKNKKMIFAITLFSFVIVIINIISAFFLQFVIDQIIPHELRNPLKIIALGLIVLYVFQSIFTYLQDIFLAILSQNFSKDIVMGYIKHVFSLPMSFFSTRKTGDIISRFNDANKIIDALSSTVMSLFLDLSVITITAVIIIIQNGQLALLTMMLVPLYVIIILSFSKKFEKLNQKQMESNASLSSTLFEDIRGIETIKSSSGENKRFTIFKGTFFESLKRNLQYKKAETLQKVLKLFVQLGMNTIILWAGSLLTMQSNFSVGQLMTFNALLSFFLQPLQNIINLQPKLKSAKVANNRLNEIYMVPGEDIDKNGSFNIPQDITPQIKFNHVNYRYGYGANVLEDICLNISANSKIAIVGMSGSGKSTLAKLLINFFSPSEGNIKVNDRDMQNISKKSLRKIVKYTPQEPYVFSGTVLENLEMNMPYHTAMTEVEEACKKALILEDIKNLPLGFSTMLDENGSMLSGGQKQRLVIARALLSSAKVLIFDESTSGLDTITEKKLSENLVTLKDKTVIFIAHRLAVAKKTNKIIVLDKGKIVESGSHSQLMEKGEYYYSLVNS